MDSLMVTQRWRQRTRIEVMFNAVPGGNLTSIDIPPVNVTAPNTFDRLNQPPVMNWTKVGVVPAGFFTCRRIDTVVSDD